MSAVPSPFFRLWENKRRERATRMHVHATAHLAAQLRAAQLKADRRPSLDVTRRKDGGVRVALYRQAYR